MRTTLFILSSIILGFTTGGCSGNNKKVPEGEFLIEGYIENIPDSTIVTLCKAEDRRFSAKIVSDTIIGGKFILRDTMSSKVPQQLELMTIYKESFSVRVLPLWITSGAEIKIQGEGMLCPFWEVESNVPEQKYESEFTKIGMPEMVEALNNEMIVYELFRKDIGDISIRKQIDSIRNNHVFPLEDKARLRELEYMKTAPVTKVWLEKYYYQVLHLFTNKNPEYSHKDLVYSLYGRLSEEDKNSRVGREIAAYMKMTETVKTGENMVDGILYDTEGNKRSLSEFKGKYILLDFWSIGCQPCMASIPEMEEVGRIYKEKLETVSIGSNTEDRWKKFIKENNMTGNQWNELRSVNDGLAAAYGVKGVPHYVLISPECKVIDIWTGYRKGIIKEKIEKFVK